MIRKIAVCFFAVLISATLAVAQGTEADEQSEAKELSGMSIVGNDEAPKSLYIVPWKSSEIGLETNLNMVLNDGDGPVDRDVFMRQLEFYTISTAKEWPADIGPPRLRAHWNRSEGEDGDARYGVWITRIFR